MLNSRNYLITFCCALLLLAGMVSTAYSQKSKQVEIINADRVKALKAGGQRWLGNVKFKHEGAIMTCDSAYIYEESRDMDAFGDVELNQGDTLFLYGDRVHYDGETRIAQVRRNVKLIDDSTVLVTDYLDYNRETEIAYYLSGGVITSGENELTSEKGFYNTKTEIFAFKDSVVINNPDYNIYSDTLEYNTNTEVAYFFGPTEIIGEDNYIYCEKGWYDTRQNISLVNQNAFLRSEERILKGDTLYYERENGFGEANSNVELHDSTQNIILRGNHGLYYEESQLATLTDSALMIQVDSEFDSLYVHADTLRSIKDTADIYGEKKIILAYKRVKIYREDIQGMCDSLTYIEKDSTFHMFGEPVLWSDENQITATKIEMVTKDQNLHRLYLRNIALLISQEDSVRYNQIRGKNMIGYFENNQLVELDVTGNGQTLYYREELGIIYGANYLECSDLKIFLEDNKVSDVKYLVQPSGKYYPLDLFPKSERYLNDFSWRDEWRPKIYSDVFKWK